jgi:hypothetical protein
VLKVAHHGSKTSTTVASRGTFITSGGDELDNAIKLLTQQIDFQNKLTSLINYKQ